MSLVAAFAALMIATLSNAPPPVVEVTRDDTVIDRSCRIRIPKGAVIEDKNDNGVIRIAASDIVVEFVDGAVLRGAAKGVQPDQYDGFGIRLNGRTGVTLRNVRVSGFRCGIYATAADGLTLEDCDTSDCRRARLKSTPAAEDAGDWIYPHKNDAGEWLANYASAIYIKGSKDVTVRRCRVRRGQNGLCLDRVTDSRIYDNDFSFLSGWGIALWRSSGNVISRNAVDFCIRGYSHGVYNRGQDSAGFLVFEQCNDNVFAENSATYGGDGFFGFAGREALGQDPAPSADFSYLRRGCNDNLLVGNDFSYAAAHGIEMTFSFGNRFLANRLVDNAICGVWGGYSQDTLIAGNMFVNNGELGYGLERGGVNIEHGRNNQVLHNTFRGDKCGVHFWWDAEGEFTKRTWGLANGSASSGNTIAANTFTDTTLAYHFRGPGDVALIRNTLSGTGKEIDADPEYKVSRNAEAKIAPFAVPTYAAFGETRPVGDRKHLHGRENIIMTQWGPWDHASPLVRLTNAQAKTHVYELRKMPADVKVRLSGDGVTGRFIDSDETASVHEYAVASWSSGVYPYSLRVRGDNFDETIRGTILAIHWEATFFKWGIDPREDLAGWRKLADGPDALRASPETLTLKYAFGGPSEQKLSKAVTDAKLGGDHFGMIARGSLRLPKGKWQFKTMSDDGIRVVVDGKPIIEDWTWHGPKPHMGVYEAETDIDVEILVEHFEIDGYSTLEFEVSRVPANP